MKIGHKLIIENNVYTVTKVYNNFAVRLKSENDFINIFYH